MDPSLAQPLTHSNMMQYAGLYVTKKNCTNKKCKKSRDPFPSPTLLPVDLDAPLASRAFLSASTLPPPPPPPEPPPMPPPAPPPPPFCCSSISSGWLGSVTCCRLKLPVPELSKRRWVALRTAGSSSSCHRAFRPCRLKACLIAARYEYQNMSTWRRVLQCIETAKIHGSKFALQVTSSIARCAHIGATPNAQVLVFLCLSLALQNHEKQEGRLHYVHTYISRTLDLYRLMNLMNQTIQTLRQKLYELLAFFGANHPIQDFSNCIKAQKSWTCLHPGLQHGPL